MSFFVAEFAIVMQFLWKYIDNLVGKGISLGVLLELIFYFAVRMIPEAVPVTILISSVMVFGNLAEKYELSSMKSAGISLIRIMMAGSAIAVFTALFSLFSSNYLKPRANFKFYKRFVAVKKQDPTLNIEEGIFADDFKNYTIRVGKKHQDGEQIEDILIYDTSDPDKKRLSMLVAKSGKMYSPEGENRLVMDLIDGEQYRELTTNSDKDSRPFVRTRFEKWTKNFDMSDFDFEAQDINQSRNRYDHLNARQLQDGIDSMDVKFQKNITSNYFNFGNLLNIEEEKKEDKNTKNIKDKRKATLPSKISMAIKKKDRMVKENTLKREVDHYQQLANLDLAEQHSLATTFSKKTERTLLKRAKALSEKSRDRVNYVLREERGININKTRYLLKLHQQFSWAFVCIVFLFIGAPLGSIVKKGGYGYPLLIAIVFFMLFMIMKIMGEKLTKTGDFSPILAAWLPNLVLIPFAIIITYLALKDSDFNFVKTFWLRLKKTLSRK